MPMPVMRNAGGYVRVFRSMLDWEWYDDTACVRLMLHLLLTVNWEAKQWHGQTIQPGQLVTSMDKLAETLGTTRSAIRRTMDKLKSSGEVTVQTNNHWTTVTLGNWAEYQEVQPTNGRQKSQPTANQRPTTDRPSATTEEVKKERREEQRGANPAALSIEDRKGLFLEACKKSIEAKPDRMLKSERQGFLDYWTEPGKGGKMRFEAEDFFDHGRRMDTWMANYRKRNGPVTIDNEGNAVWNARA